MDIYEIRANQMEELQKIRFESAPNKELFWNSQENAITLKIVRLRELSNTNITSSQAQSKLP